MEIWQRAKSFAEEAAKRSQTLTSSSSFKISDIVTETAKRSKDFAAEASKKADELRSVALKSLSDQIPALVNSSSHSDSEQLERFGVTDDLREFVKGLTLSTFKNFPIQDELPVSDVPTFSNVQQDLTEWQQKHATLVLTTVQEISKLRYELCPRLMKERKFWKIYFTLVNSHVALYEKRYMEMEEVKQKETEQIKDHEVEQTPIVVETNKSESMGTNLKSRTSTSSAAEQDLDTFLLGDLEDSDGVPDADDDDKTFDDDFDKINSSDVEDEKHLV